MPPTLVRDLAKHVSGGKECPFSVKAKAEVSLGFLFGANKFVF